MAILLQSLRKNFRVKLGMFSLAVLLWFLVVTEKTYEYIIDTPIHLTGLKLTKTLAEPLPASARVKYHARGRELVRMLYLTRPHLRLDLTTINHLYTFRLKPEMIILPGGMNAMPLEIVEPETVRVALDEKLSLSLLVAPRVDIEPEAGYIAAGMKTIPNKVEATGPKHKVEGLKSLNTVYRRLENVKRSVELDLYLENPANFGISINPTQVKVIVNVERLAERTFPNLPIRLINRPAGKEFIVEPAAVTVHLIGGTSVLSNLADDDIEVYIDCSEFNPARSNTMYVKALCESPVTVAGIEPSSVRIFQQRR